MRVRCNAGLACPLKNVPILRRKPVMKELRKSLPMSATRFGILTVLGAFFIFHAAAQQPGGQTQQPPPTVTGAVRNFYNGVKNNIIRSGEKMPEEFYGLRPGSQEEVRTFGHQLSHVAIYNYLWCAEAKGEKNPNAGINLEKTLKTKDEILKALRASYDYCDGAYETLNDATGSGVITITQESGRKVQQTLIGLLMLNVV